MRTKRSTPGCTLGASLRSGVAHNCCRLSPMSVGGDVQASLGLVIRRRSSRQHVAGPCLLITSPRSRSGCRLAQAAFEKRSRDVSAPLDGDVIARRFVIHGRVQGVGYRMWAQRQALQHGLEGFVRNRRDGSVEALVVGSPELVTSFIEACRRGPPGAAVTHIHESESSPALHAERRQGERFSVLPTV